MRQLGPTSLEFGAVPHPQYWRRFFNSHRDSYRDMVDQAAATGEDLRRERPLGTWYDRDTVTAVRVTGGIL